MWTVQQKHSFQQEAKPGCTQRSQYVVFWANYPTKLLPHKPHSTWNSPVFSCSSPAPFRRGCYDITDEMCEGCCCCCRPPGPRPSPRGCRPLAVFTGDSVCSLHSSGPSSHNGKSLAAFHCLRRTQASAKKKKEKKHPGAQVLAAHLTGADKHVATLLSRCVALTASQPSISIITACGKQSVPAKEEIFFLNTFATLPQSASQ